MLVNRSKSSSEKSTGLSKELCRLGDRQASPAKKVRSGSVDDDEEAAEGAEEEVEATEESRCSENDESEPAVAKGLASLSSKLSAEFVEESPGGEW